MRRQKKEPRVIPMNTKLSSIDLRFNYVHIYRDLPRCDHMILFKNLYFDTNLSMISKRFFPIQTFYKYIKKRKCDICKYKHVTVVTRKDKISPKQLNFLCQNCFEELHLE